MRHETESINWERNITKQQQTHKTVWEKKVVQREKHGMWITFLFFYCFMQACLRHVYIQFTQFRKKFAPHFYRPSLSHHVLFVAIFSTAQNNKEKRQKQQHQQIYTYISINLFAWWVFSSNLYMVWGGGGETATGSIVDLEMMTKFSSNKFMNILWIVVYSTFFYWMCACVLCGLFSLEQSTV